MYTYSNGTLEQGGVKQERRKSIKWLNISIGTETIIQYKNKDVRKVGSEEYGIRVLTGPGIAVQNTQKEKGKRIH